jgi:hypothetical protein
MLLELAAKIGQVGTLGAAALGFDRNCSTWNTGTLSNGAFKFTDRPTVYGSLLGQVSTYPNLCDT